MNYYKRHIGDYMKDASHLSLLEHGVYMRLLDVYYTRESSIPIDQAARLIGARSKDEKEALSVVASEFFVVVDGFYLQSRCELEISAMQQKAETNRDVGKRGGRPKKVTKTVIPDNPEETQTVISGLPEETQTVISGLPEETQTVISGLPDKTLATSQEPLTINQEPIKDTGIPPTRAGAVCVVFKSLGIGQVNPQHETLLELLADGAQVQEFEDAGRKSIELGKGFAYALGIVKNSREDAKRKPKTKPLPESFKERDDRKARERWEQMTGQTHPDSPPKQASNVIDVTPFVSVSNPEFLEISQ